MIFLGHTIVGVLDGEIAVELIPGPVPGKFVSDRRRPGTVNTVAFGILRVNSETNLEAVGLALQILTKADLNFIIIASLGVIGAPGAAIGSDRNLDIIFLAGIVVGLDNDAVTELVDVLIEIGGAAVKITVDSGYLIGRYGTNFHRSQECKRRKQADKS